MGRKKETKETERERRGGKKMSVSFKSVSDRLIHVVRV